MTQLVLSSWRYPEILQRRRRLRTSQPQRQPPGKDQVRAHTCRDTSIPRPPLHQPHRIPRLSSKPPGPSAFPGPPPPPSSQPCARIPDHRKARPRGCLPRTHPNRGTRGSRQMAFIGEPAVLKLWDLEGRSWRRPRLPGPAEESSRQVAPVLMCTAEASSCPAQDSSSKARRTAPSC